MYYCYKTANVISSYDQRLLPSYRKINIHIENFIITISITY